MRITTLSILVVAVLGACGGPIPNNALPPPDKPIPSQPVPTMLFVKRALERGMWGYHLLFDATDNGRTPDLESVVPDPEIELHADKVIYTETNELNEVLDMWFDGKLMSSTEYTITVSDTKNHFPFSFTTPTVYGHLEYLFKKFPVKWVGGVVGCRFTGTRNFIMYGGRLELGVKVGEDVGNLLIYDKNDTYLRTFAVKYDGLVGQWQLEGLDVNTGENITCENI